MWINGVFVLPASRMQDPSKIIGTVVQLAIPPVDLFKCEKVVDALGRLAVPEAHITLTLEIARKSQTGGGGMDLDFALSIANSTLINVTRSTRQAPSSCHSPHTHMYQLVVGP